MASTYATCTSPAFSASSCFAGSASQDYDFGFVCLVALNVAEVQCCMMDADGKKELEAHGWVGCRRNTISTRKIALTTSECVCVLVRTLDTYVLPYPLV